MSDIKTIVINQGKKGQDGNTILNGSGVPSSGLGKNGDFYINTATFEIYGPKAAGSWGSPSQLTGSTLGDFLSAVDNIQIGETFTVPERKQMVVYDGIEVNGDLVVNGTLILED
jgi:hypothetical protein